MSQKKTSYIPSKKAHCPRCYRLLCKRIPMHNEDGEVMGLHIKHRGLEVFTGQCVAVFTCLSCGHKVLVNSEKGVIKQDG